MREKVRDYIRFFGYTGQHELGDDGSPFTEFFEYSDVLKEGEQTGKAELNGYKRMNERTLSALGTRSAPFSEFQIDGNRHGDVYDLMSGMPDTAELTLVGFD